MARIEHIQSGENGSVRIKDDKGRDVFVCPDGARDLMGYAEMAARPSGRRLLTLQVEKGRDPLQRYLAKVALDAQQPEDIINGVAQAMRDSF